MTESRQPGTRLRWILATTTGAVAVALAVVIVVVLVPARHRHERAAAQVGLTALQQQAVDAGAKQVVNLLTYSRATFDADYARAVAGATGALKSDLLSGGKKATLLSQLTTGKFDLQGQITASAFEDSSGANYAVLISAQGYQVPDGGTRTQTSAERFEVTLTLVNGKWLASDLQSVGLI